MSRFNENKKKQTARPKGRRICLYVDPTTYTVLKSALTLEHSNPSQFFEKVARAHLLKKWPHMLQRAEAGR